MPARNLASDYYRRDLSRRTWDVTTTQAGEIAEIANSLGAGHSALVRALLGYSLAALRDGRLRLATRPTRWEIVEDGDI